MRAKFINENNEGSLHPSMPSLTELKDIFEDEINSVVNLIINDNGSIEYDTYPGSSLKSEIKELFKSRGWDKFYNIKKIEFEGDGGGHEYIINPYKSDSERIIPSFDPNYLGSGFFSNFSSMFFRKFFSFRPRRFSLTIRNNCIKFINIIFLCFKGLFGKNKNKK